MNVVLKREIEIEAPAAVVWEVLTETQAYPRWNPFVRRLDGDLAEGSRIEVRIAPPEGRPMTFRPRVRAVTAERELRWLGHLGVPGLFDGEHRFVIEALGPATVRFVQSERFSGLLVRLLRGVLGKTEAGFDEMNHALKDEAERVFAARPPEVEAER